jgi:GDP-4-dehydro-6-deoxy-D-mannose reductase
MRIFVTGAGGFLGPHLISELIRRGHQVAGSYLDKRPELDGVELYEADLLDRPALSRVVAAARPDAVAHLAGLSHVGESWQRIAAYFDANVLGTENVLAAAAGRPMLLASSSEVYGMVPEAEQPIAESRRVAPQTPYALTKAAAERITLAAGGWVARTFNLIGPGQARNFALPAFAEQLRAIVREGAEPVLRVGNLGAQRDFVPVEDGARGYATILERGVRGEVYNVATGHAWSIRQALDCLLDAAGAKVRIEEDPSRVRPVDIPLLRGDNARLRGLGWALEGTLSSAVQSLWRAVNS